MLLTLASIPVILAASSVDGQQIYDYYCYQCHGYSGDGQTAAARSLDPPPRNFTRLAREDLSPESTRDAVANGRPGTAMVAFGEILTGEQVAAVSDYIGNFMIGGARPRLDYHTTANGWPEHRRYAAAFPYALGELDPGKPPGPEASDEMKAGLDLFLTACVTCHPGKTADQISWRPRAVSYPRRSGFEIDAITGATPYSVHDRIAPPQNPTASERAGYRLFDENCAFCHGADGSGKNWIGSFLERPPMDLTSKAVELISDDQLHERIRSGIEGTSMPAWGGVLSDEQIWQIVRYIRKANEKI